MHIERIDTFPLFYRLPKPYGDANGIKKYRVCYLIRITSSEGIEGWGECADWLPTLHLGFQERIIPYLLGKSVYERKKIVTTVHKWHSRAAAAVDMALTELAAKRAGLTVCELWGGAYRESVPVYASFQSYSEDPEWPKQSLLAVEEAAKDGFTRMKLKIGGKSISDDQKHINKVQGLLEQKVELALDANQSYDLPAAMEWNALLNAWPNIMWLEEPLEVKHVAEYALLRSRMCVPLAGGENVKASVDYIPILTEHAFDFLTPDPMHMESLDDYRHSLQLARDFGLRATPHDYDGVLARLYSLFAQACLPPWSKMESNSIEPVEWDVMDNPFTSLIPVSPCQGEVRIPQGAGIGVEIDLDMLQHYRWDGNSY